jgi:hypothetical protein
MALPVRPIETTDTKELKWGHTVVGTTAVKLTALEFKFEKGLLLRAPGSSDVTADSNAGTGGMPLAPGESINLPVDDPTEVYVISDAASQDIAWMGV